MAFDLAPPLAGGVVDPLRVDPGENVNLYGNSEYTEVQEAMRLRLRDWLHTMPGPYGEFKRTSSAPIPNN